MKDKKLDSAIKLLSEEFVNLDWNYKSIIVNGEKALLSLWPGNKNEDIMICVSNGIHEQFHRQEFFFFNYAYKSDYTALSENFENKIVIKEGECYIGQPFAGYSLITEKRITTS